VTSQRQSRYCGDCETIEPHHVETNEETGWERERCMSCGRRETVSPHEVNADE